MITDITIVGAGLAGLIASIKLAHIGFDVICVDYKDKNIIKNDLRTTALLLPSINFLNECNIWEQIKSDTHALNTMRIMDISDAEKVNQVEFHAKEIGEENFGYNIQNQVLYNTLNKHLKKFKNIKVITDDKFVNVKNRTDSAFVELKSGNKIRCKLLIGADGKNSSVRDKLDIPTKTKNYNQKALAFKIEHQKAHLNVSTEIYKSGGPFTIVPLADQNQSAVIWMDSTNSINHLLELDDDQFNNAITSRSGKCLGALRRISDLTNWPIINQYSKDIVQERCLLIAEAAHVLPPIGAQGLNMSIQDIKVLASIVEGTDDPGSSELLKKYNNKRKNNSKLRMKLIDGLNLSSIADKVYAQKTRSMAIQLIASSPKLKSALIKTGLGELS